MNAHALAALLLAAAAGPAAAHVTLPPGGAPAGSVYLATFRVGHACQDASTTTGIRVRLPAGFTLIEAQPRPGWALASSATEVSWTADPGHALPATERTTFDLRGRLPGQPGTLFFEVRQVCENGAADWAERPPADGSKAAFPAARLEVLPAN